MTEVAVKVTELNVPKSASARWQKIVGPLAAITGAAGKGNTLTSVGSDAKEVHPLISVTLTVYRPALVTSISLVVNALLQRNLVAAPLKLSKEDCNFALIGVPSQNPNLVNAVIVGVFGLANIVISTSSEISDLQPIPFESLLFEV